PWMANRDVSFTIPLFALNFDSVRVEVTQCYRDHGSLAEIQVFRACKNIALGGRATASDSLNADFAPGNLTDGVNSSAVHPRGYWLLPRGQPGWAEVEVRASAPEVSGPGVDPRAV